MNIDLAFEILLKNDFNVEAALDECNSLPVDKIEAVKQLIEDWA